MVVVKASQRRGQATSPLAFNLNDHRRPKRANANLLD
jgi:hypothetical protein